MVVKTTTAPAETERPGVPGPQAGDVLLTEEGPNRFTLAISPGTPQLADRTSARLASLALRFAESHRLDGWTAKGHYAEPLARYRDASTASTSAASTEKLDVP